MYRSIALQRVLTVLIAVTTLQRAVSEEPRLSISFHDDGVSVFEGQTPVLSYQAKSRSYEGGWQRASYVHPLYNLRGEVITEDFPEDHRHHRGIFWAWHQVWVGDQRWAMPGRVRIFSGMCNRSPPTHQAMRFPSLPSRTGSRPDSSDTRHEPIAVVEEQTRIVVHAACSRLPGYRFPSLAAGTPSTMSESVGVTTTRATAGSRLAFAWQETNDSFPSQEVSSPRRKRSPRELGSTSRARTTASPCWFIATTRRSMSSTPNGSSAAAAACRTPSIPVERRSQFRRRSLRDFAIGWSFMMAR